MQFIDRISDFILFFYNTRLDSFSSIQYSLGCLLLFVCGSENITTGLIWNWEPVGEGFRCVAKQPMRLLGNCVRAQHTSMKNEICNVEMWT